MNLYCDEVIMRLIHSITAAATVAACVTLTASPVNHSNPFFQTWKTPFGVPPFEQIKGAHFMPAFQEGMKRHKKEIAKIVNSKAAPSFKNTIEALDASGGFLTKVDEVFSNLNLAETTPELQAIAKELSPLQSAHFDDISLSDALFKRVKTVYQKRGKLKLEGDQKQLLEKTYKGFVRSGANLNPKEKERLRAINAELSLLAINFGDNVLKENNAYKMVVHRQEDLDGLPEAVRMSGAETAKTMGLEGKWVYTLQYPSIWPFLTYSKNRELRKEIFTAYTTRCDHGNASDNKKIVSRIASLRVEKAHLLGYKSWGNYVLEQNMAKTPEKVNALLDQIWAPALQRSKEEARDIQSMIDAEGGGFQMEPWDWFYYSNKIKKAKYDLDEEALKPYFPLERVRQGAFDVASKLFNITFTELKGMPVYHPEVKVFEVKEKTGKHVGVFYTDYHPRPGKKVGAWMSNYRSQRIHNGKDIRPVVVNVGNFARPIGNAPALLSVDEAETLFHEFGHALHGLLTRTRYASLSGTNVPRDFVELPSQIMEHWAMAPAVLKQYARHHQSGEPIPDALIQKMQNAQHFNQGFTTLEYLAASKLDIAWHSLTDKTEKDAATFEKQILEGIGLIPQIVSRYRTPYFNHMVNGYDAGYYGYIWANVLDTDAFQAFKEKGDIFHPATASSFKKNILEKGGSADPMMLYKAFRGAEPSVEPLLKKRGLK